MFNLTPTQRVYVHRFSYELHKGEIPEGLVVNHLCMTPLCVNPAHLEVATYSENSRYGDGPAARRARQTHCKRGHPLSGTNLYITKNGTRHCRTCSRDRARENMRKRRAESTARLAAGDDSQVPHGTISGYFNHGCRCPECSAAQRTYDRTKRLTS